MLVGAGLGRGLAVGAIRAGLTVRGACGNRAAGADRRRNSNAADRGGSRKYGARGMSCSLRAHLRLDGCARRCTCTGFLGMYVRACSRQQEHGKDRDRVRVYVALHAARARCVRVRALAYVCHARGPAYGRITQALRTRIDPAGQCTGIVLPGLADRPGSYVHHVLGRD